MNILSISQIQTQKSQSDFLQVSSLKAESYEKSSFADFLKDAQGVKSDSENKTEYKTTDESSLSKENENIVNSNEDSRKIAQKDKNSEDSEPAEKITDGKFSEDEKDGKTEEIAEKNPEVRNSPEYVIMAALNQNTKEISKTDINPEKNISVEMENFDSEKLDSKTISWLTTSNKIEELGENISSEDFAKMIDAAVEFIPGFESDEEKLESAQTLASSDPKLFLEMAENNLQDLQQVSGKKFTQSDSDKKLSSVKDSKEKNTSKLSVHDLRTHRLFDETSAKVDSTKAVQKASEKKEISLSIQQQNENNIQMTMELQAKAQANITSSSSQAAGATGSDFQQMLSNAVQENAPDFVKAGNIVLKDNNQGSINLILRPEGLGNVKISLNLDDKNLSAQITVQTKEAMDAFRESIPSLKQAFTESGFETGSFDLNFSNNQQGFAQNGEQGQKEQNAGILANKNYGEFVTSSSNSSDATGSYLDKDYSVNIVA